VLRAAAPLMPYDIHRDWLHEWRAEFGYAAPELEILTSAGLTSSTWRIHRRSADIRS
jgi:hypothetical protein